ncbi:MAG: hypothetical protein AB7U95_10490, partial [Reyranella sp.]
GVRNSKTMALGMLIGQMAGGHPAAWLHPEANAHGATDIDYFRRLAQEAERGLFDLFFIGDTPAARTATCTPGADFRCSSTCSSR